jgi:hypothetical protein
LKNKTVTITLFAALLLIFILYFSVNHILNRSYATDSNLTTITQSARNNNWEAAHNSLDEFENFWKTSKNIIAFNNTDQTLFEMETAVADLKTAVDYQNTYDTERAVNRIQGYLAAFKQIVPKP